MAKKKMYQRPDGLYEKKLTINEKRIYFRGRTEKEVMQKILAYEEKAERGPLFDEIANGWWAEKEPRLRYGSVATYRASLERAISFFGDTPIQQIDGANVSSFLLQVAGRGFSQKTVSKQLMVVRAIFKHALMHGHIKAVPTDHISIPAGLPRTKRTLAPPGAIDIIKQTGPDDFLLPALILYTGARVGEALALQWRDLHPDTGTISITKAVVYHSNRPVVSAVKTDAGARNVPLLVPLQSILEQRTQGAPDEYIIGGGLTPITSSTMTSYWLHYCRSHGLAHKNDEQSKRAGRTRWTCDIDRHTLRHEYATILYEAQVDARTAQELMGHADIATTLKIYTHIRQKQIDAAGDTLNAFLTQKT